LLQPAPSADTVRHVNGNEHFAAVVSLVEDQPGRQSLDRLCGLVVRILGYRSGGPGSIPCTTRKNVVGLERGALSLMSTN
jgi:hypothetical protein